MMTRRQPFRTLIGLSLAAKGASAAFAYTVPKRTKNILDEINAITLEFVHRPLSDNFFARGPLESRFEELELMILDGGEAIPDPLIHSE